MEGNTPHVNKQGFMNPGSTWFFLPKTRLQEAEDKVGKKEAKAKAKATAKAKAKAKADKVKVKKCRAWCISDRVSAKSPCWALYCSTPLFFLDI